MDAQELKPALLAERAMPTREEFDRTILPSAKPMVLRGAATDWPLVGAAKASPAHCAALLVHQESGIPVTILRADPDVEGRFHYADDSYALNFIRCRDSLSVFLAALREMFAAPRPYAIAAQGLLAEEYFPGFRKAHPMPLAPEEAAPRLWIGNAGKVATHNDPVDNIAVVAAGRRRFTLFPPEAVDDLYMGPDHPTPAGTPISMVHVTKPNLDLYPRFAEAMKVAQVAELDPGDAIFIPRLWYHHVEALERFNILVNYWWDGSAAAA